MARGPCPKVSRGGGTSSPYFRGEFSEHAALAVHKAQVYAGLPERVARSTWRPVRARSVEERPTQKFRSARGTWSKPLVVTRQRKCTVPRGKRK